MTRFRCFTITPLAMLMAVAFGWTCPTATAQIACRYEVAAVITVPPCGLGERQVYATAISPNGRYVCGYYCQCLCGEYESFVYDMNTSQLFTIPRGPGMFNSRANDVSDAGVVVGFVGGTPGDFGYIYDYPTQTYLQLLSSPVADGTCEITGISSSGVVCGTRTISGPPNYESSAFIWSANDGFLDLGLLKSRSTDGKSINNHGIVGVSTGFSIDAGSMAYRWDGGAAEPLGFIPGGLSSSVVTMNDNGWALLAGITQTNPIVSGACVRTANGQYIPLPPLPGQTHLAITSMTSHGLVGGNSISRACLWKNGTPIELSTLLIVPTNHQLQSAYVSDSGTIMCRSGTYAVILEPVFGVDGDTDCNTVVDHFDLLEVVRSWGVCAGCNADLTMDGRVGVADLLAVIINWTKGGGT